MIGIKRSLTKCLRILVESHIFLMKKEVMWTTKFNPERVFRNEFLHIECVSLGLKREFKSEVKVDRLIQSQKEIN